MDAPRVERFDYDLVAVGAFGSADSAFELLGLDQVVVVEKEPRKLELAVDVIAFA